MSNNLQVALTYLTYAIVLLATVFGIKYQVIDSNVGSLIIGGVLTHFGTVGYPTTSSSPTPPSKGQEHG